MKVVFEVGIFTRLYIYTIKHHASQCLYHELFFLRRIKVLLTKGVGHISSHTCATVIKYYIDNT